MEESIEIEEKMEKPTKPKRQLTQVQLDQLAKAREKANAVRKQNAEMKKKEKRLEELQRQVQEEEIDEEIQRYSAPSKATRKVKSKPKKKPKKAKAAPKKNPDPVESEEDTSGEDWVPEEESSSSEEEEEEDPEPPSRSRRKPKKKHSKAQHYQPAMEDVYAHQMNRAFGSLFPNYNV